MEVLAQRVCVCARADAHALGDFIISRDSCVPVHSPAALLAFLIYRSIYSQEAGMVFPPPAIFFLEGSEYFRCYILHQLLFLPPKIFTRTCV